MSVVHGQSEYTEYKWIHFRLVDVRRAFATEIPKYLAPLLPTWIYFNPIIDK